MPVPSLTELRVFDAAVRLGSFSAAARELGVTQQAVSARIRGLERVVGFALVARLPGGIAPTEQGDAVLAWARDVLTAADRLEEGVAGLRGSAARALRIAASQTVAAHLLPDWIVDLRNAQTANGRDPVATALRTANSREVVTLVRDGDVDLGFIESPETPRDLGSVALRCDQLVVAVARDHPWAGRSAIPLEELADTALVSREVGSGTREAFERAVTDALGRAAADPLVALATEAAVRSAAAQGVAPAVLSELTVRDDVRLGRVRAIAVSPRPIERSFSAIWRGGNRDLTGAARELVALAARSRAA